MLVKINDEWNVHNKYYFVNVSKLIKQQTPIVWSKMPFLLGVGYAFLLA